MKNFKITANFFLRKLKNNNLHAVYCRIIVNGKRAPDFSTKIKVSKEKVKYKPFYIYGDSEKNEYLKDIKLKINRIFKEEINKKGYTTAKDIKNILLEKNKNTTLEKLLENFMIKYIYPQKDVKMKHSTIGGYVSKINRIKKVLTKIKEPNMLAIELNDTLLEQFLLEMKKLNYCSSYINRCTSIIKKSVEYAVIDKIMPPLKTSINWKTKQLKEEEPKKKKSIYSEGVEKLCRLRTQIKKEKKSTKNNKKYKIKYIAFVDDENNLFKIDEKEIFNKEEFNELLQSQVKKIPNNVEAERFKPLKIPGIEALEQIEKSKKNTQNHEYSACVIDAMLFQIFTGFDFSDVFRFDVKKHTEIINHTLWIRKVREKRPIEGRGQEQFLPLCPIVFEILIKHGGKPPIQGKNEKTEYKKYAKEVAKVGQKIGLTFHLKTKTLRKTFTMERLRKGVSTETIARMVGHNDIRTTQKYYTEIEAAQIIKEITVKKY